MFNFIKYNLIGLLLVTTSSFVLANGDISKKEFDCVIVPSNIANLGSNSYGIIGSVAVDRNSFVKRGDVIAVLANDVEQATVELISRRASMTSDIELASVNLAYTKRELSRAEKAFKNKAFSTHDIDVAKVEAQLAKIKFLQAKEKQKLIKSELKRAKAELARKTIFSPVTGVVIERFKVVGEYIDDEAVVRVAQLDPLHVEVIVPVSQRDKIKKNMRAQVCADTEKGSNWIATVSQVDKVMDAASGTFGVRLILPNPDYEIPAGLRCDLKFFSPERIKR
jgi:RND family efflux transporter MFP subunit